LHELSLSFEGAGVGFSSQPQGRISPRTGTVHQITERRQMNDSQTV